MDLSIIIVNYRDTEKILACLKSVAESDLSGIEYEVIVVDNGVIENIEAQVSLAIPTARYISNKKNLGMGAGNNVGIKKAEGEYVLVLNHDTRLQAEAAKNMLAYISRKKKVALVAPELVYPDGEHQDSCFRFPSFWLPFYRRTFIGKFFKSQLDAFLLKNIDKRMPMEVDWVMGSCLLIRKSALEKIGNGFDERFWMYFEDIDLCHQLWQAGYKVIYFPTVQVVHDHGRGSAKKPWFIAPLTNRLARAHIISWLKYFWKWRGQKTENRKQTTENRRQTTES
ncbi:glycosyltransferase family 2 protein [Candidatus Parcubacteria bacterium]|nr:glycosyltransferase family 2 protein [Candidatus Parcubacteria bacterium]